MNNERQPHINRASEALFELNDAADRLDTAAQAAIAADTAMRDAKTEMDNIDSILMLAAVRDAILDGKNAEIRDAQFRFYRNGDAAWQDAVTARHDATVNAARARQVADSAAARFDCAKAAVQLHVAILGLLGRAL